MLSVNHYNIKDFKTIPKKGWFKPCYICEIITSHYVIINDTHKYYFCNSCIKKNKYFRLKHIFHTFEVELF